MPSPLMSGGARPMPPSEGTAITHESWQPRRGRRGCRTTCAVFGALLAPGPGRWAGSGARQSPCRKANARICEKAALQYKDYHCLCRGHHAWPVRASSLIARQSSGEIVQARHTRQRRRNRTSPPRWARGSVRTGTNIAPTMPSIRVGGFITPTKRGVEVKDDIRERQSRGKKGPEGNNQCPPARPRTLAREGRPAATPGRAWTWGPGRPTRRHRTLPEAPGAHRRPSFRARRSVRRRRCDFASTSTYGNNHANMNTYVR